jgi:hypothetical protein
MALNFTNLIIVTIEIEVVTLSMLLLVITNNVENSLGTRHCVSALFVNSANSHNISHIVGIINFVLLQMMEQR